LPLAGSGKGSAGKPLFCCKLLSSICRDEANNNAEEYLTKHSTKNKTSSLEKNP
jgi:hypothetical protein